MNRLANVKTENFINLKGLIFAEYNIIYHINDCFSVQRLVDFRSKHQLLFQGFENRIQQMNLVFVDGLFPTILADLVLDVFLRKSSSFNDYINSSKQLGDFHAEKEYLRYKFLYFIHQLLYSDISSKKAQTGEIRLTNTYCFRDYPGELKFFSIYDQTELQMLLLERITLSVDKEKSSISKEEVNLNFQISFS